LDVLSLQALLADLILNVLKIWDTISAPLKRFTVQRFKVVGRHRARSVPVL